MFWKYNCAALGWALFMLVLCGFPWDNLPKLSFLEWLRPDKIVHLIIFGIQSFLLARGFSTQNSIVTLRQSPRIWAASLSVLYGVVVEVLQTYVFISRTGDARDA